MNRRIAAGFTAAVALNLAFAVPHAEARQSGHHAVLIPASDIKWADVPGFPGVQMAALEGNPGKGPHHSMLKFAGGFAAPVHHHSADHWGTVVSGTLVLTVDGKEYKLPPGSHFSFTGREKHATGCEAGADCVIALDSRSKWDVVMGEVKPGKKK